MMNRRGFLGVIGVSAIIGALGISPKSASAVPLNAKYKLIHNHGSFPCGETAFYLTRKPKSGDAVMSADFVPLNGEKAKPYSNITCGTCGGNITPRTEDIEDLV